MGALLACGVALAGSGGCFETVRDIPAGAALAARDVAPADCRPDASVSALRYDRGARSVVAAMPLAAGTYVGRVALPEAVPIAKGTTLVLRSAAGLVVIEREVTALQAARPGEKLFVRDADGNVFAVRYVEGKAR